MDFRIGVSESAMNPSVVNRSIQFLKPEINRILNFVCDFVGMPLDKFKKRVRVRIVSSNSDREESYFDEDTNVLNINLQETGWDGFNPEYSKYWQYLVFHEIGHLFEEYVAKDAKFIKLFGDVNKDYDEDKIYQNLPKTFSENYVSRYATKHPSEDWAETFATALIIRYFNETDKLKSLKTKNFYSKIRYVYSIKDIIKRKGKDKEVQNGKRPD